MTHRNTQLCLVFALCLLMALLLLLVAKAGPWTLDYKVDLSGVGTFMAVIIALAVAFRDMVSRSLERRHSEACFIAYHRPTLELILMRVACSIGVISKHRAARLGEQRPYENFKFTSKVMQQDLSIDIEYVLRALAVLPVRQAEKLAYVLGVLPKLRSDFLSLAMMNADVQINDKDQDLIKSILNNGENVVAALKDFMGMSESDMNSMVDGYIEVIVEGGNRHLVRGTR